MMQDNVQFLKHVTVVSVEVKTGSNMAEPSKESYGSKKGCFANDDYQ
jgi:hypothetical protein